MQDTTEEQVIAGIEALIPPLLTTMEMLGTLSRHLHPPTAPRP